MSEGSNIETNRESAEQESKLSWRQIQSELSAPGLDDSKKRELQVARDGILSEIEDFDRSFVSDLKWRLIEEAKGATWDTVYGKLIRVGNNFEKDLKNSSGYDPNWNGAVSDVVDAWASLTVVRGIDKKFHGVPSEEWLDKKHYSDKDLRNMALLTQRTMSNVGGGISMPFGLPRQPEELVGDEVEQKWKPDEDRDNSGGLNFAESFAQMMGKGTPEQQRRIYLKAEEEAAAPIQMTLEVPGFLLASKNEKDRQREEKEWRARGSMATAAFYKKQAVGYDKLMENPEAITMTADTLKTALCMEGVFDASALYTHLIADNPDISGSDHFKLPDPKGGFINSVFDIKNGTQFETMRKGMVEWLVTERGLSEEKATDAEHVAWNLIYVSNMVEEFDSVYEHPDKEKRIPPASSLAHFRHLPTWMTMHPQERLTAKASGGIPESMGRLGEWSVYVANSNKGKFNQEILPRTVYGNALREIKIPFAAEENGKETEVTLSLFEVLRTAGGSLDILDDVRIEDAPWDRIQDPFGSYYFDKISPAGQLFSVVMKGKDSGIDLSQLGNLFRKLETEDPERPKIFTKKQREIFLMIHEGVKPNSRSLTPIEGVIDWQYTKGAVKRNYPSFFE